MNHLLNLVRLKITDNSIQIEQDIIKVMFFKNFICFITKNDTYAD